MPLFAPISTKKYIAGTKTCILYFLVILGQIRGIYDISLLRICRDYIYQSDNAYCGRLVLPPPRGGVTAGIESVGFCWGRGAFPKSGRWEECPNVSFFVRWRPALPPKLAKEEKAEQDSFSFGKGAGGATTTPPLGWYVQLCKKTRNPLGE